MRTFVGLVLFHLVLSLAALPAAPGAGHAQARAAPAPDPARDHPVLRAVRDILQGAQRERGSGPCRIAGRPVRLTVLPFSAKSEGVTEAQKRVLLLQIRKQFAAMAPSGVSVSDYDDLVGGRNTGRAELLRAVDYAVTPVIIRVPGGDVANYRLALSASHSRPECGFAALPADLGDEHVVEPIHPPETMFETVAQRLVLDDDGDLAVVVQQPQIDGRGADDDQWKTVERSLQRALQDAVERSPVITTSVRRITVSRDMSERRNGRDGVWRAEVQMSLMPNRMRADINVIHPIHNAVSDTVFVEPSRFVATRLRVEQSALQASLAPAILRVSEQPSYVRDMIGPHERERLFLVEVRSRMVLETVVDPALATGPLSLTLSGEHGGDVEGQTVRTRPGLTRFVVGPGRYVVRIRRQVGAPVDYVLRVRGTTGTLSGELAGRYVQTAGDWIIGEFDGPYGRECYAATPAVDFAPSAGWRTVGPVLQFRTLDARQERGNAAVVDAYAVVDVKQVFDDARHYAKGWRLQARIGYRGGAGDAIPIGVDADGAIASVVGCPAGTCLDRETIPRLTRGQTLTIQGVTAQGQPATVTYSLRGYAAAMNALAALCGNPNIADRLVVRR
jgi:hypothetical protein